MKVLCNRDALRQGLAVATTVIPVKTPKPILSNVCLVATADALELVGTDFDVSLRYRIEDVKVIEPGTAVVSARTAHDFVRDLSGETIELTSHEGSLTIASGADSGKLVTADADEFPVVARFADTGATTLQGGTFPENAASIRPMPAEGSSAWTTPSTRPNGPDATASAAPIDVARHLDYLGEG